MATGRMREQWREQLRKRQLPSSLPRRRGRHLSMQQICEARILMALFADGETEAQRSS